VTGAIPVLGAYRCALVHTVASLPTETPATLYAPSAIALATCEIPAASQKRVGGSMAIYNMCMGIPTWSV